MTTPADSRRRERVLLVDDEPRLLEALQRSLHREPFHFVTATSGADALTLLARERVDAVVSDQDMPGMSGVTLLSIVSKSYPETVRFMLTGKATLEVAMNAINQGSIHRFFTKPMNPAQLAQHLKEALRQKALMAEAWKLLRETRRQRAVLEKLESQQPGITRLNRDATGAILLEESPQNLEELLAEIEETLGDAGRAA
jgi:DNA-binding NtrC family response regulator